MPKLSAVKITKTFLDAMPSRVEKVYFDSELKGYGVRTKAQGKATYILQYRNRDGVSRRYTIGQVGAITPVEARGQAKVLLGRIAGGEDIVQSERERANAETVSELCDAYVKAAQLGIDDPRKAVIRGKGGRPKKASTLKEDKSRIERHIKPLLGNKKVRDVKPKDISKFLSDVTVGKTAIDEKTKKRGRARVSGGAGIGSRTVGLLGGIFSWAITQGIVDTNPCRGVSRAPDGRRKVRLNGAQYRALGDALRLSAEEGEPWQAVEAIWTIALTGCRRNEIACLRPREVDVSGDALRLTDTKEHESIRPLGRAALGILRPRMGNTPYVFHSDRDVRRPYGGLPAAFKRVLTRMPTDVEMPSLTLHALRHAYASTAGDLGYTTLTIKQLIGHSTASGVTEGYIHALDEVLIAAADRVSRAIADMMAPAGISHG